MDVGEMTDSELVEAFEAIHTERRDRENRRRDEARKRVSEIAAEAGCTPSELMGQRKGRKSTSKSVQPPKYRGPDGQTWSGKGRRPEWFKAALSEGATRDDVLIAG